MPATTDLGPLLRGSLAMTFVGGSAAVAALLDDAPLLTSQAVRYAVACVLLLALARLAGRRLHRPRGREWWWLAGVAATGLVLFNVALVRGSASAEPAVLGVAVACVPVLLAVLGPLLERRAPRPRVLLAATVVTVGAVLVSGTGRVDTAGLGWAAVVLGCEAAFTLLAVPVLARHGAWGVSVHTTWLAALGFGLAAVPFEGPAAALQLQPRHLAAVGYLAVLVTAVAFVLWYGAVRRLGAGRTGLLTGVAPVAAALVGLLLGEPVPAPTVWLGIAVVTAGLALGLGAGADRGGPAARHPPGRTVPVDGGQTALPVPSRRARP